MNTTVNGSSCSNPANSTAEKIVKTFALCLILVVSLVGNSCLGVVVYKTQTMRKPVNYLIINMAISDLLYPVFFLPVKITLLYTDSWLISGPLGQVLCKLLHFLTNISSVVSIETLVLITVDRFGAVVFPLRSPLISSKLCPFFILATWIVAMAMNSPHLLSTKLIEYPGKLTCENRWNEAFGESSSYANYVLAIFIVFLYIPFALLAVLYSIVLIKLKKQVLPGEQSANAEKHRARRNRSVLKMAIAILLGFVLCWAPYSIIALVGGFAWNSASVSCGIIHRRYYLIALYTVYANCAINPCICFIFSGNYRQGLKSLLNYAVQD